jgi:hypothetical protein
MPTLPSGALKSTRPKITHAGQAEIEHQCLRVDRPLSCALLEVRTAHPHRCSGGIPIPDGCVAHEFNAQRALDLAQDPEQGINRASRRRLHRVIDTDHEKPPRLEMTRGRKRVPVGGP